MPLCVVLVTHCLGAAWGMCRRTHGPAVARAEGTALWQSPNVGANPCRCLGGACPRCMDASQALLAANSAELLRRELEGLAATS